jgi:hypothetical protein
MGNGGRPGDRFVGPPFGAFDTAGGERADESFARSVGSNNPRARITAASPEQLARARGFFLSAPSSPILGLDASQASQIEQAFNQNTQNRILDEIFPEGDPFAAAVATEQKYNFWTSPATVDPKSQFRWRVIIPGMSLQDNTGEGFQDGSKEGDDGTIWYAKTINKPTFAVKNMVEGRYPVDGVLAMPKLTATSPELKPITMTLIDPVYPNATRKLIRYLRRSGFQDNNMKTEAEKLGGATKSYLATNYPGPEAKFGEMYIEQLSSSPNLEGSRLRPPVLERWTLIDPYPIEVNFGDLNYSSDDLVEISVTWGYRTFKVFFPEFGGEPQREYFAEIPAANSLGGGAAGGLPGT